MAAVKSKVICMSLSVIDEDETPEDSLMFSVSPNSLPTLAGNDQHQECKLMAIIPVVLHPTLHNRSMSMSLDIGIQSFELNDLGKINIEP
jgi:hypothetical protein